MTFKDFLKKDLDTFQNLDEFSEEHIIEGESVTCMVDSDIISERSGGSASGIYENAIRVYIKEEEIEKALDCELGYGDNLMLDHREYTVINWINNAGMVSIDLSQALAE